MDERIADSMFAGYMEKRLAEEFNSPSDNRVQSPPVKGLGTLCGRPIVEKDLSEELGPPGMVGMVPLLPPVNGYARAGTTVQLTVRGKAYGLDIQEGDHSYLLGSTAIRLIGMNDHAWELRQARRMKEAMAQACGGADSDA